MPDEIEQNEEQTNTEAQDAEESEGTEDAPKEGKPEDDLPEWAREKLTKANAEAANYRVKLRAAEDRLKDVKTPEQVEELMNQLRAEREEEDTKQAEAARALLIENVALKFKLPEELSELLQGGTREELEAHAKKLQKFAPVEEGEPESLGGGLTPNNTDTEPTDPGELARRVNRGRRKR